MQNVFERAIDSALLQNDPNMSKNEKNQIFRHFHANYVTSLKRF